MSTLLLRLAAPMQSWGVNSKFNWRYTEREPSKSGVIGLCAAALGYLRSENDKIDELAGLRFGVRIDKPGKLIKDFQMAHEEEFWNPNDRSKINQTLSQDKKNKITHLTMRYYLADAAFLVGLEGEKSLLRKIGNAICAPVFPLYLGRRSCPPEGQVFMGIVPDNLEDALRKHPPVFEMRIVVDSAPETTKDSYLLRDLPQSFNPEHRRHDFRLVSEFETNVASDPVSVHDPLITIEEVSSCT
jgi:CRISPR system Cascade subunit CasD